MKRTIRCVVLAMLSTAAISAVWTSGASAFVSGHFVSEVEHTTLKGTESGTERTEFKASNATFASFNCEETSYLGTMTQPTAQQITVVPSYAKCVRTVEGGENEKVEVKTNGCEFLLRIGPESEEVHSTAELACPVGKKIEITSGSGFCPVKVAPQVVSGVDYTTVTQFGKHAVTVDVTIKGIAAESHGWCALLGTNSTNWELAGSVQVSGFTTWEEPVGITATGGAPPQKFRSEVAHTSLAGSQSAENVYTFGILVGKVQCATTSVSGTTSVTANEEITLAPTYGSCKGLEREVTVNMNGCAYVLKFPWSGSTASFAIECPAEKFIETTYDSFSGGCTITIGAQNASGNVDVKNEGAGTTRDILLTWTLSGLKYKRDGCEVGGEATNGTYSGSVTLKGQDTEGTQKGIWYG